MPPSFNKDDGIAKKFFIYVLCMFYGMSNPHKNPMIASAKSLSFWINLLESKGSVTFEVLNKSKTSGFLSSKVVAAQ